MASALMAFVQGLVAEQETPSPAAAEDAAEGDDLFVDSDQEEATAKPTTLLDVARVQQVDAQPPTSLLTVAQQQQQAEAAQATASNAKTLAALAAQVDREDEQQRREAVQQTLELVAKEVRDERQQQTRGAVATALQEAAADQYAAEEFEAEEGDARVLAAAQLLVQQKQQVEEGEQAYADDDFDTVPVKRKPATKKPKKKKTQHPTPRTMRDKLSAFQCRQLPLTLTQRRLLLATLTEDADTSRSKMRRAVNMEAINELATDRARRQQQSGGQKQTEFAKLDDNRHCRFRPRLKAGGSSRENQPDDEDGGGKSEDFVRRMEATERARAEGLRRTREEKLYLARVDKKECPACGNPQSYAELSQKRKKCPNCGVAYRSRIAWSSIADEFLARLETYVADRERVRSSAPSTTLGTADEKRKGPTWAQVRDEFLGRMQLDLEHRELSKAAIWEEMAAQCTFRPAISRRAQALALGSFDERLRRDMDARRQRQEQYVRLRQALARGGDDGGAPTPAPRAKATYAPSAPFQERLRLDLQRRREREQLSQEKTGARQLSRAC